jgi:hypothetical protein
MLFNVQDIFTITATQSAQPYPSFKKWFDKLRPSERMLVKDKLNVSTSSDVWEHYHKSMIAVKPVPVEVPKFTAIPQPFDLPQGQLYEVSPTSSFFVDDIPNINIIGYDKWWRILGEMPNGWKVRPNIFMGYGYVVIHNNKSLISGEMKQALTHHTQAIIKS